MFYTVKFENCSILAEKIFWQYILNLMSWPYHIFSYKQIDLVSVRRLTYQYMIPLHFNLLSQVEFLLDKVHFRFKVVGWYFFIQIAIKHSVSKQ